MYIQVQLSEGLEEGHRDAVVPMLAPAGLREAAQLAGRGGDELRACLAGPQCLVVGVLATFWVLLITVPAVSGLWQLPGMQGASKYHTPGCGSQR